MFGLDQKALFELLPLSDENKIRFLEMLKAAEAAEVREVKKPNDACGDDGLCPRPAAEQSSLKPLKK